MVLINNLYIVLYVMTYTCSTYLISSIISWLQWDNVLCRCYILSLINYLHGHYIIIYDGWIFPNALKPIDQIPISTMHPFHIPWCTFRTELFTFLIWMVCCEIWYWCILRFVRLVYSDCIIQTVFTTHSESHPVSLTRVVCLLSGVY